MEGLFALDLKMGYCVVGMAILVIEIGVDCQLLLLDRRSLLIRVFGLLAFILERHLPN